MRKSNQDLRENLTFKQVIAERGRIVFTLRSTMVDKPVNVDEPANFVPGPTRGSTYSSIYLVDGDNYLYSRKKKKSDGEFGRHLWLCIEKNCSSSASTLSKEGADTKTVAFGSKKHQHVSNQAKVTMIFFCPKVSQNTS